MEEIDRRILDLLRRDARESFASMAGKLGVSEATIRRRVRRLVEEGYIQAFTIEEGRGIKAIILINTRPSVSGPETARSLSRIDGVKRVYEVSGQYDLIAVIFADTTERLDDILEEIRRVEGVERTYTCIVLRSHP